MITLGCRLNIVESEAMRALAGGEDDLIIVNSCAVTNAAVRQTRQAIRRAKRARPGARLVVTGCAAQVEPGTFAAMPEVDRVVGNGAKFDASSFSSPQRRLVSIRPPVEGPTAAWMPAFAGMTGGSDRTPRSRGFVAVQNGCDHRCTFCIIPYGRGPSRSEPAGAVIERIKALVDAGCNEVVLTGVDVTSYGPDLPGRPSLGLLVERILRHVPALKRLRLSSLDCIEIDPRLEEIIAHEPRFMPHLHMSFQAGDDTVLKRMKRRHSRAEAVETVRRLKAKRPELAIGADLIAGFPTETEEMHENSVRLIAECDIVMAHVFPFSPKAGTPAARMPQVAPEVVKARARRLREAGAARRAAWLGGMVGTRQRVLVESSGESGHAENFAPVVLRHSSEGAPHKVVLCGDPEGWNPYRVSMDPSLRWGDVRGIVEVVISAVESDSLVGAPL